MLVLARKPGEAILIGTDIRIYVVSCTLDKVRIGIEAPDHIPVWREELVEENPNLPNHPHSKD